MSERISYRSIRHESRPEFWRPLQDAGRVIGKSDLQKEAFWDGFWGWGWAKQNLKKGDKENLHRGSNRILCIGEDLVLINAEKRNQDYLLIHSFNRVENTELGCRIQKILGEEILQRRIDPKAINDIKKIFDDGGLWEEAFCAEKGARSRPWSERGKKVSKDNPYEGSNIFVLIGDEALTTNIKNNRLSLYNFARVEKNDLKVRVVDLLVENRVITTS